MGALYSLLKQPDTCGVPQLYCKLSEVLQYLTNFGKVIRIHVLTITHVFYYGVYDSVVQSAVNPHDRCINCYAFRLDLQPVPRLRPRTPLRGAVAKPGVHGSARDMG